MWITNGLVRLVEYSPANADALALAQLDKWKTETFFTADSVGGWELIGVQVEADKFRDRAEFDEAMCRGSTRVGYKPYVSLEKAGLKDALKALDVFVEVEDEAVFNQRMIEIYGESDEDEEEEMAATGGVDSKSFMKLILKDFRVLEKNGNWSDATARRGRFYVYFIYWTS